ncbi:MAG: NosD domain-containing protein [Thermoplasmatota archaeon]
MKNRVYETLMICIIIFLLTISVAKIGLTDSSQIKVSFVRCYDYDIIVPDDFPTIQLAVEGAASGDRIYVRSGVYNENIIINKAIFLIGEDKNSTVISGDGSDDVVSIVRNKVTFSGFTVENGGDEGVQIRSNQCLISDNIITLNMDNGLSVTSCFENEIVNNHIILNNDDGLAVSGGFGNTFKNNNISNNYDNGIVLDDTSSNTFLNNHIESNRDDGIDLDNSNENYFIGNTVKDSQNKGIYMRKSSSENQIYFNNFIDNNPNAYDEFSNTWHNSKSQEGNYWDEYSGKDNNNDGIGDIPYLIDGGTNSDMYPLMNIWGNSKPDKPYRPNGEISGEVGVYYNYTSLTNDPDDDQIWYKWDWGDGNFSEWIGPFESGDLCLISNNWSKEGNFEIRVKAKDIFNQESEWSDPLEVAMPHIYKFNPIIWLIEQFIQRFPFLEHYFEIVIS